MTQAIQALGDLELVLAGKPVPEAARDVPYGPGRHASATQLINLNRTFDGELAPLLEKVGMELRRQTILSADLNALQRLALSTSPQVSRVAKNILSTITPRQLVTHTAVLSQLQYLATEEANQRAEVRVRVGGGT